MCAGGSHGRISVSADVKKRPAYGIGPQAAVGWVAFRRQMASVRMSLLTID
jgi:hypothetical protein